LKEVKSHETTVEKSSGAGKGVRCRRTGAIIELQDWVEQAVTQLTLQIGALTKLSRQGRGDQWQFNVGRILEDELDNFGRQLLEGRSGHVSASALSRS
jgi:hypothetical protein